MDDCASDHLHGEAYRPRVIVLTLLISSIGLLEVRDTAEAAHRKTAGTIFNTYSVAKRSRAALCDQAPGWASSRNRAGALFFNFVQHAQYV